MEAEPATFIQQFPDHWELAGPLVQQYKQVGNAVPIGLGLAVGTLVSNLIKGREVRNLSGFQYSRYKNTSHTEWRAAFRKQAEAHKAAPVQIPQAA